MIPDLTGLKYIFGFAIGAFFGLLIALVVWLASLIFPVVGGYELAIIAICAAFGIVWSSSW